MNTRRLHLTGCALALYAGLALALALGGCRSAPHRPTPCTLRAPAAADALTSVARIPATTWLDLLAPDHHSARVRAPEVHTCSGGALQVDPLGRPSLPLPSRPPEDTTLTITAIGDDVLLWAPVVYYEDGDALGVLAILSRHPDDSPAGPHLEVRTIGALRAPAISLEMRVETLDDGVKLVLARGRRCPSDGPCVVEIQVMPWVGARFIDAPLRSEAGAETARIRVHEAATGPAPGAWTRDAEVRRQVRADDTGVTITETVHVRRCTDEVAETCHEEATLHRERPLTFDDDSLYAAPSVWPLDDDEATAEAAADGAAAAPQRPNPRARSVSDQSRR